MQSPSPNIIKTDYESLTVTLNYNLPYFYLYQTRPSCKYNEDDMTLVIMVQTSCCIILLSLKYFSVLSLIISTNVRSSIFIIITITLSRCLTCLVSVSSVSSLVFASKWKLECEMNGFFILMACEVLSSFLYGCVYKENDTIMDSV